MTTKIKTVKYQDTKFSTYADERAKLISEGWKVLDVNLVQEDKSLFFENKDVYVTGNIVYERK